uniref:Basic proline-rich protein n=1 Tax=Parastrongyloides trichosuri TaxID=131310 RepID=A0A0N5A089_PARTI
MRSSAPRSKATAGAAPAAWRPELDGRLGPVVAAPDQRADRQSLGRGRHGRAGLRRSQAAGRPDLRPRQRLQRPDIPLPATAAVGRAAHLGAGSARSRPDASARSSRRPPQLEGSSRRPDLPSGGDRRPARRPGRPFHRRDQRPDGRRRAPGSGLASVAARSCRLASRDGVGDEPAARRPAVPALSHRRQHPAPPRPVRQP